MQKLIDFITLHKESDPSMAGALKFLESHPENQEEVIVMIFSALYDTNMKLASALIEAKNKEKAQTSRIVDRSGKPLRRG